MEAADLIDLVAKERLSAEYVATGLDACHKRIAELEEALRDVREYAASTLDTTVLRIIDEALA